MKSYTVVERSSPKKALPSQVTIYSLEDIVTLSNWTKKQQLNFFKRLDKRHSWGDTTLTCITLKDVKAIAKQENLTVAETVETNLPDSALVEIDWDEPCVDDE
jgi:hypothetical protein